MVAGGIDSRGAVAACRTQSLVTDNSDAARQTDQAIYGWAAEVLFEVRKQRSEAKQPLKVPISRVTVRADLEKTQWMPIVGADLRSSLRVQAFETTVGAPQQIVVLGYEAVPPAE